MTKHIVKWNTGQRAQIPFHAVDHHGNVHTNNMGVGCRKYPGCPLPLPSFPARTVTEETLLVENGQGIHKQGYHLEHLVEREHSESDLSTIFWQDNIDRIYKLLPVFFVSILFSNGYGTNV
jgi:hypothetical protein